MHTIRIRARTPIDLDDLASLAQVRLLLWEADKHLNLQIARPDGTTVWMSKLHPAESKDESIDRWVRGGFITYFAGARLSDEETPWERIPDP